MRPRFVSALLLPLALGCVSPPPPAERATNAARELNLAARFGRMDLAVARASPKVRREFMQRRALWGKGLRVVDVELTGLEMSEPSRAVVYVDVAWVRVDESTLRSTRVAQHWEDEEGGWLLTREKRVAGDVGLFGELVLRRGPPRHDVHFPSKTIR
jgi:hypothetical protein